MTSHSILAPSDSQRWLRCVGAIHMSRGLPNLDAEYNASGTCSHWLLEWALNNPALDLDTWLGKELKFGTPEYTFKIDEERLDRVRQTVTQINREPGEMLTEHRLNTTPVLGVPDQEGHSDIIKLYPEGGVVKDEKLLKGVITVHDFKDGYLLVNAKDNTQGMIYLCAALMEFGLVGDYNAFRFCIHQPKINHYDEWTYTRAELEAFMAAVRPVAKIAYDIYHGVREFDPEQHLNAGEEQCFWCPVRGRCPARAKRIISMFTPIVQRHELDDKTLSLIHGMIAEVRQALSDYETEAHRRALMGATIDGFKLVYGNKGKREWSNEAAARAQLELVLPSEKVFKPAEIISPTEAEKLLKKSYEPLAAYVTQAPAQLRLVPIDHKGEAVSPLKFEPVKESLV
ncbi:MAG TPA: DUF2800 domain-containing protein [Steroidobacteraceae bacterium]|nr:DUF2800 domain-containing protein [Steroidobacteraceae bacterium]